ncbi:MAG TPA: mannosyltransferase family protein [Streptosporangiaceae bacterium]|nr:mannosyltransferase family protein [Streptosporangiaceae bacterium]
MSHAGPPRGNASALTADRVSSATNRPAGALDRVLSSMPAAAMGVFAATRVITLFTAAYLLPQREFRPLHSSLWGWMTGTFDSNWYAFIAAHGYPGHAVGTFKFFPGYPAAIDAIAWIPGISVAAAGIVVTSVAGLAAAWGIARLGLRLTGDPRTSVLMAALWGVAPGAMVLSMMYSEALFCALAVWALVALVERRWLTAGVLCLAAGLVHSNAVALIGAVAVAALICVVESARAGRPRTELARPVAAVVLAPLGFIAWWVYVAVRLGRLDGLTWDQAQIHESFDWGSSTLRTIDHAFVKLPSPYVLIAVLALLAALVLVAWSLTEPTPAYLRLYSLVLAVLAVTVSATFMASKLRLLLPAFPVALLLAKILAPARTYVLVPLIAFLAVASAWFTLFLAASGKAP